MPIPFLDLKTQYRQIESELRPVLESIMANGAFIGGPEVTSFEAEFAAFCGSPLCVGMNSGTDALRFAMMAVGLRPGDEVITVANTFIATTETITQAGGKPVFVDIDPATCTIDVNRSRPRSLREPARSSRSTFTASRRTWTRSWKSPGGTI